MIKKKNKTKKRNGLTASNGIMIDGDIALSYGRQPNKDRFKILQFLITFFTAVFTVTMTISYIDIDVVLAPIIISTFMLTLAFMAVNAKNKIVKLLGAAYVLMLTGFLVLSLKKILNGFFVTVDQYLTEAKQLNSYFEANLQDISYRYYDYYATYFFIFLSSLIVSILAIACITRIDFPLMFLITFPFFELGMYWELIPSTASVTGLIICWITVLSLQIINHTTNKAGRNNTFAVQKNKKNFYFTSETIKKKFFTIYAFKTAMLCLAVFLIPILFANISGSYRTKAIDEKRIQISNAVHNFSFNKVKNILDDYDGGLNLFDVKTVGGTNGGILGDKDSISFNGSTALKVNTAKPTYPLYLRGYVAGRYTDNSWKEIEFDEDDERLQQFDDQNYYTQDFNYYINNSLTDLYENKEISVTVLGASKKFVYAPYMTSYASDSNEGKNKMNPQRESYVNLSKNSYTLQFLNMSKCGTNWNDIISMLLAKKFFNTDYSNDLLSQQYQDFVNEYYTDVPSSDAVDKIYNDIIDRYFYGVPYLPDDTDITYYIESISDYFRNNFKYTLSPGATPEGEDFIDYFLTEQKEGYCSYFASAGVMLMRKYGVPARYVEGYVVLPTQFEGDSVNVTDKAAHAWCEIYLNDIGWVPCEFTPGYDRDNPNLTDREKDPSKYKITTTTTTTQMTSSAQGGNATTAASTTKKTTTTTTKSLNGSNNSSAAINGGKNNSDTTDTRPDIDYSYIKLAVAYLIGLIIIIAVIILRRKYNLSTKAKKLEQADNKKAIQNAYCYYMKYLSLVSVGTDKNITDMQAVNEILTQCSVNGINGIDSSLKRLAELAVESFMSENSMTDDEADFARKALKELSDDIIYPKLSAIGRFSAKWIYNLY